jgi:hypothetical protein
MGTFISFSSPSLSTKVTDILQKVVIKSKEHIKKMTYCFLKWRYGHLGTIGLTQTKMKIWCPKALNQEWDYSILYLTSHLIHHTHMMHN